jgi:uncharacterized protein YutD
MIEMGNRSYEIVTNYRNAWDIEAFRLRYSEVLDRYDYIVGDWGYNQLRLRGFFNENNPRVTKDTSVVGLKDYIHEYCNFGCKYFIIMKTSETKSIPQEALES